MGDLARAALERATRALTVDEQALCQAVVDADDEIDRRYLDIERRVVGLLARQAPIADQLRLLTAILHISLHLERVGDMAVNIARLVAMAAGMPRKPLVMAHLEDIGQTAEWMVDLAMQSFRERDAVGCQRLPPIDDCVDEHAVDIAEQVWFLVTGELQEFGDARAPTPAP
jgi:phosphate transport system protein